MEQVCLLLVRLQSHNGWSAIKAFGGGGGEERERREGFENYRLLLLLIRGEGGRWTMSFKTTPFWSSPFYIYIYETASFWIKRVVSFKWAKLQISPPLFHIRSPPLLLAAFFTLVLGLWFMQLSPQLINKLPISSIRPLIQSKTTPFIYPVFPNWSLVSVFHN